MSPPSRFTSASGYSDGVYSASLFYSFVRAIVAFALRLFYRVRLGARSEEIDGPVIYAGNHPNALIDPALIFIITRRHVTFLAKAPLFAVPVLGWLLKALAALPVYRKQDDPSLMKRNEASLESAGDALVSGRAITLFPEGRSHSEPQLAELKTGVARIAIAARRRGAEVKIVPVGLTYAEKNRFRSEVLIEIGEPIDVPAGEGPEAVQALTGRIASGLRRVTLNLEQWEDLPLIGTAETLYALHAGEGARDPERTRAFAEGVRLLRAEQPERFEGIRKELMSFRRALEMASIRPGDLALTYRPLAVFSFVLRNLIILAVGLPLAAVGLTLFALPFHVPRWIASALKPELDIVGTVKFLATLVIAPLWLALLAAVVWTVLGFPWAVAALLGSIPLALLTRYFLEHWRRVARDVRTFFVLSSRQELKARLLREGEALAAEIESIAAELRPRISQAPDPEAVARP
jgi:glycerol-3-phosphate O-acyltransferase / dihydroxyacetone phosphate acyltransferase